MIPGIEAVQKLAAGRLFAGCFMVIIVILRAFLRMTMMPVVRDTNARWRASVPTARRGRIHARARVLPGKRLTAGCLAGVFWGVSMGVSW